MAHGLKVQFIREDMVAGASGRCSHHIAFRQEAQMDGGDQFALFSVVSLEPQAMGWFSPHSGRSSHLS